MSKAEIIEELPRLTAEEREEVLDELWRLQEAAVPTPEEVALLDQAQARFNLDQDKGEPWEIVRQRLFSM